MAVACTGIETPFRETIPSAIPVIFSRLYLKFIFPDECREMFAMSLFQIRLNPTVFKDDLRLVISHPALLESSPSRSAKSCSASFWETHSDLGLDSGVTRPGISRLCVYSHNPGLTDMIRSAYAKLEHVPERTR